MSLFNGQEKEYREIQNIQDGLLSINGSLKRLNINTNLVEIVIPSEDFNYLSLVIENTEEHKFKKFYKKVDDKSFILGSITVVRGGK